MVNPNRVPKPKYRKGGVKKSLKASRLQKELPGDQLHRIGKEKEGLPCGISCKGRKKKEPFSYELFKI